MIDMVWRAQQLVPVNTIAVVPSLGKGGLVMYERQLSKPENKPGSRVLLCSLLQFLLECLLSCSDVSDGLQPASISQRNLLSPKSLLVIAFVPATELTRTAILFLSLREEEGL